MSAAETGRLRTKLAEAISHPLRSRCLTILADRVASPAEISRDLYIDVGTIGYHVKTLNEAGLIEEVRNRHVRGAVEHFYRAVVLPHISAEEEAEMTPAERNVFAETTLSVFAANASRSLDAGTLTARTEHWLTRVPLRVDDTGLAGPGRGLQRDVRAGLRDSGGKRERLGKQPEEPGIPSISFLTFFKMP